MSRTAHIPLSEDATLVAALAGTAMPFSRCAEEEAERWLRALRLHGEVGRVLQAIGVGEGRLETVSEEPCPPGSTPRLGEAGTARVAATAERLAADRAATTVGTADLLLALLDVYDGLIDDALAARGAGRAEVLERLAELR